MLFYEINISPGWLFIRCNLKYRVQFLDHFVHFVHFDNDMLPNYSCFTRANKSGNNNNNNNNNNNSSSSSNNNNK